MPGPDTVVTPKILPEKFKSSRNACHARDQKRPFIVDCYCSEYCSVDPCMALGASIESCQGAEAGKWLNVEYRHTNMCVVVMALANAAMFQGDIRGRSYTMQ